MDRILIVYPVFAMVFLTFFALVKMRLVLNKHLKARNIKFSYFKLYKGEIPEEIDQVRDHYKNLFEMPILFYALLLFIYATDNLNKFDLIFAWLFVLFKYIHSYIRLTSNYVPYRAILFIISLCMLLCGWANFIIQL